MAEPEHKMMAALRLCDQYFTACARIWAQNDGRLMDEKGRAVVGSDEVDRLCNEAAEAVARIIHAEEFE